MFNNLSMCLRKSIQKWTKQNLWNAAFDMIEFDKACLNRPHVIGSYLEYIFWDFLSEKKREFLFQVFQNKNNPLFETFSVHNLKLDI